MLGRRIGSWTLVGELGHGGMGSVFKARHTTLNTQAAVKVLSAGLESKDSFRQRFRREAELQAQLRHPNVARVLDYLEDNGQWFLVIEYLARGSLADLLSRGEKVSRQQAMGWMRQALAGLGYAHQKGIVHRDMKPANLMFSADGEIVVMDFGIARADSAPGLTATGITVGTPQYMSPEQIMTPDRVDGRADIYSLGIVLYELLAGRRPFESRSEFSVLQAHVAEPPPPLRTLDPSVPFDLESVVMRALAKKPEDRYPNCEAMARALELVAAGRDAGPIVDALMPVQSGGTIQQSVFLPKADLQNAEALSASDRRDRKRRSFQRRLTAGVATVFVVATVLATTLGHKKTDEGLHTQTSFVATATTADTTEKTATTAGAPIVVRPELSTKPSVKAPGLPVGFTETTGETPRVLQPGAPSSDAVQRETKPPGTPPPAPVLPSNPQVAVIGIGSDPMLAASLEQELERRLSTYRVGDERGDPEVDDLLGRNDVAPKALGALLLKNGFHILVVVRVEKGDERTFELAGESGSVKGARIRLNAHLLPANRTLGSGWTEIIEYTELSAAAKARQAFIGATADLRQAIDHEWTELRAGQR